MAKRLFDIIFSLLILILLLPLFIVVSMGVKIAARGPVFYVSERIGKNGKRFILYKFRSMYVRQNQKNYVITSKDDPRVFHFGSIIRTLKIDELPQFFNVLKGDMSIVGPRPEAPEIVYKYYNENYLKTLCVRPGLISPGSLYNYTHGEMLIDHKDPENSYVTKLLPLKMAMELIYIARSNFLYDIELIMRTIIFLVYKFLGKKRFNNPPEYFQAISIVESWKKEN